MGAVAVPSAEWHVHLPGRLPEDLMRLINGRAPPWPILTRTQRDDKEVQPFILYHSVFLGAEETGDGQRMTHRDQRELSIAADKCCSS